MSYIGQCRAPFSNCSGRRQRKVTVRPPKKLKTSTATDAAKASQRERTAKFRAQKQHEDPAYLERSNARATMRRRCRPTCNHNALATALSKQLITFSNPVPTDIGRIVAVCECGSRGVLWRTLIFADGKACYFSRNRDDWFYDARERGRLFAVPATQCFTVAEHTADLFTKFPL